MAGKSGRNVTYAVQEEPAFIKRFKEKIGYKEDPGIDEKVLRDHYREVAYQINQIKVDCQNIVKVQYSSCKYSV